MKTIGILKFSFGCHYFFKSVGVKCHTTRSTQPFCLSILLNFCIIILNDLNFVVCQKCIVFVE